MIAFHHEPDQWLFGGIWEVRERHADRYVVELTGQGAGFVGRLKLHSTYRQRGTRINLENRIAGFTVTEILPEPYTGQAFPGHDWIEIGFAELEALIRSDRPDWRGALEHTKGIYLITDTGTGGSTSARPTASRASGHAGATTWIPGMAATSSSGRC